MNISIGKAINVLVFVIGLCLALSGSRLSYKQKRTLEETLEMVTLIQRRPKQKIKHQQHLPK